MNKIRSLQFLQILSELLASATLSAWAGFVSPNELTRLRRRAYLLSRFSRRILSIMKVEIEHSSSEIPHGKISELPPLNKGRLIVANHTSFLDILLIASARPVLFVTSVEKEKMPIVGGLARLGGTIFIERRNKTRLRSDCGFIARRLCEGFDVVLFPEGTSGDGKALLPFRRGLFPAALLAKTSVEPVAIEYLSVQGKALDDEIRNRIFFYGDFGVLRHLGYLFSYTNIRCRVHWLSEVGLPFELEKSKLAEEIESIRFRIGRILYKDDFPIPHATPSTVTLSTRSF